MTVRGVAATVASGTFRLRPKMVASVMRGGVLSFVERGTRGRSKAGQLDQTAAFAFTDRTSDGPKRDVQPDFCAETCQHSQFYRPRRFRPADWLVRLEPLRANPTVRLDDVSVARGGHGRGLIVASHPARRSAAERLGPTGPVTQSTAGWHDCQQANHGQGWEL